MSILETTPPKYQLMGPLFDDEFEALKLDIGANGVLVAVELDEDGNILDGHHRVRACRELGISQYPKIIRSGFSEEEKRRHARRLNIARRQLTTEEKRDIIRDQIRDEPTKSARQIAESLGISHNTVSAVRHEMVDAGSIDHVDYVVDTLGRKQPINRYRATYIDNSPDGRAAAVERADDIREQNKRATNGGGSVGTKTHSKEDRGDDFYETPRCAIITLLELEKFSQVVFEPACGNGAISSVLEERGYDVELCDLRDRGCTDRNGELQDVDDFLKTEPADWHGPDIITNPPFGIANEFIAHAMHAWKPRKMAMLLNLNVLCGSENDDRNYWMNEYPPAKIYVFSRRLPMMHRDGWEGEKGNSQMNTAWLVWERDADGNYPAGPWFQTRRVDWKEIMEQAGEGDWTP